MPKYSGHSQNNINYVMIELSNESVILESGAMHYMQGMIDVETKMPSLGGVLKAGLTGEKMFRPRYTGTGRIMLTPSFRQFFLLELKDEEYIMDRGAFMACDPDIEVGMHRNNLKASFKSGEGMFQTKVSGTGTVVASAPGPVQIIDLVNDRLTVDGSFAVARSANLSFNVKTISKSLLGSAASGEGFVNVIEGTGRVYLAPIANFATMLTDIVYGAMASLRASS